MNKSESKYYNTACLMDEALLHLLETREYDYITVKEICSQAGVNRSTFYLHYETMDDLLTESLLYMFGKFNARFPSHSVDPNSGELHDLFLLTPEFVVPYLEFLQENRKIFMVAVAKPHLFRVGTYFDTIYAQTFSPILERFNVEERERKYILAFYISGFHAILLEWLRGGCVEPIDYVAGLLMKYTPPLREGQP